MKLTKHGHACVVLEKDEVKVVIDPGNYSELPSDLSGVVAVVVTHEHSDHLDNTKLEQILEQSPNAMLYANEQTLTGVTVEIESVAVEGELEFMAGPFNLKCIDHDHAVIHEASPCRNLSVQVDDAYYYPGDSYTPNDQPVEVVGVPISGPWSKTTEGLDFVDACQAKIFIPVHDAHLNDVGHGSYNNWFVKHLVDTESEWHDINETSELAI